MPLNHQRIEKLNEIIKILEKVRDEHLRENGGHVLGDALSTEIDRLHRLLLDEYGLPPD